MKNTLVAFLVLSLVMTSCTVMQVSRRGNDGYFSTNNVLKSKVHVSFDLDSNKGLLVVLNGGFMKGMAQQLNYFDRVITLEELEMEIIKEGKQDEIGALSGKIAINNAYRKYKKFLYLEFDDSSGTGKRIQLKLVNPETFDDLFVAETLYDLVWSGVNDQATYYPLFNSLVDYIKANSKTFK